MKHKTSSCTAILVGKKASIDGSTMIARDEDGYSGINPKKFVVNPAKDYTGETFVSKYSGVKIPLTGKGSRFTATPNGLKDEGRWDEQGINEYNVAMSATETELTNPRMLGHDPLAEDGINEDAMVYLVLPFIKTAREGVARLGQLIEKYGTGESNGIAFSDHDEVWYLETVGGHHWAAQRIPDDAYAICPNITCIEEIDFNDQANFMYASDLKSFAEKYHLNPNPDHFNFRKIFGTQDEADAYYNTPRAWYGQKLFTPSVTQEPTSQDIPFIQKPERQISPEDIQFFLASHYNGTVYDPFNTSASGNEKEQKMFRSIALDRNQSSCILQIRNDVPAEYAAIQWVKFGFYAYSAAVPFFTNIEDTPENYKIAGKDVSTASAYWLNKTLAVLVEPKYHQFIYQINGFRDDCQSYAIQRVEYITKAAKGMTGEKLTRFLTAENNKTAAEITKRTKALMSDLVKQSLLSSNYQFERGDNL